MRAKFGSDPTAGSKIWSFKFISRFYVNATEQWYLLVLFLFRNNNSLLRNNEIRIRGLLGLYYRLLNACTWLGLYVTTEVNNLANDLSPSLMDYRGSLEGD